jgi:GT2 family glycosyltransferase
VVIVSYRSAAHLPSLLQTLPVQRLAAVTVVDNASDDGSVEAARAAPGVHVIARATNAGFGTANNEGASATAPLADLLLFLNPDARIAPADIVRLASYLDSHPRAALVGPRLWRDAEPLPSSGGRATVLTELRRYAPGALSRRLPNRRHDPQRATTGSVAYVEGACMLVRRVAFDAVGGFDPAFFLFFEELDLADRLRAAGWTVDLVADATAHHEVAASRRSTGDDARPVLVESTVRYLAKHRSRAKARVWAAGVRPLWWLRVRRGQLSPEEHVAYKSAARRGLS